MSLHLKKYIIHLNNKTLVKETYLLSVFFNGYNNQTDKSYGSFAFYLMGLNLGIDVANIDIVDYSVYYPIIDSKKWALAKIKYGL
jgi:hypothetical protein